MKNKTVTQQIAQVKRAIEVLELLREQELRELLRNVAIGLATSVRCNATNPFDPDHLEDAKRLIEASGVGEDAMTYALTRVFRTSFFPPRAS